jgi:hypothetical protein
MVGTLTRWWSSYQPARRAAGALRNSRRISMDSIGKRVAVIVMVSAIVFALVGCAGEPLSAREKGTLVGGGLGAATGAIIGSAVGSPGAGAAIGGGLGAVGGALVGNELQNREVHESQIEARLQEQQREIEQQRREIEKLEQHAELD